MNSECGHLKINDLNRKRSDSLWLRRYARARFIGAKNGIVYGGGVDGHADVVHFPSVLCFRWWRTYSIGSSQV